MVMIDSSNQEVIDLLIKAVSPHIPDWYGSNAVLDSRYVSIRVYPYSFFINFRIRSSSKYATLLVKIIRKPNLTRIADAISAEWLKVPARGEYEMSKLIWKTFADETSSLFTAVEPLGFFNEYNAIFMRKVEGRLLKEYLLHPATVFRFPHHLSRLRKLLKSSVEWLRIFHNRVADLKIMQFPVDEVEALKEEILMNLVEKSRGQVNVKSYKDALERALNRFRSCKVPVALLHDDFQYSNILVAADGRACVLDYALNYRGVVYSDLATLIIDPQTRSAQIFSGGRFISQKFLQSCRQAILNTYFREEAYSESVLNFYCALAILNKWSADEAMLINSWRKKFAPFLSHRIRLYYSNLLIQYM